LFPLTLLYISFSFFYAPVLRSRSVNCGVYRQNPEDFGTNRFVKDLIVLWDLGALVKQEKQTEGSSETTLRKGVLETTSQLRREKTTPKWGYIK
jgi:hypothetical protein